MRHFNIAADFKKETIDGYSRLNDKYPYAKVIETYGNITVGNHFEGGRVYQDIPKIDLRALEDYISYSRARGIEFNYSLNGSCMGNKEFTRNGAREMIKFLGQLYDIGVRGLTVALPSVMEIVKTSGYDFEIKVSIIAQITNVNKALSFKKLGGERIVVDESLNRNFHQLKKIREAFGPKTEIIINSLCHKDCIYRMFHYNQTAHDSVVQEIPSVTTFYNHRCMQKRAENVSHFFKLCWVRPEDLHFYESIGLSYFKIQGRHTVMKGEPVRAVESYFREDYDGNLIDLLELFGSPYAFKPNLDNKKINGYITPFYEKEEFCKRDCEACRYCEKFARTHIDFPHGEEMNRLAVQFYREYDPFRDMLGTLDNDQSVRAEVPDGKELNGDFDFN